ncbi:polysaccharide biosynthesis C-terminal domain-containing protein [bacterium]|nr:polysaccharide biosynthesis C-terminal domain-containing protein [bacterium]
MLKKIGFNYISIYLVTIFTFVNGILVARYYGPEGKGLLATYFFIPSAIILYLEFGINESIVHYISSNYRIPKRFLFRAFSITIILSLIILFIYAFNFNREFWDLGVLGPFTLILLFSNQLLDSYLKGRLKLNILSINNLLKAALFLFTVAVAINYNFSVSHILEGYIIVLILSLLHLSFRAIFLDFDKSRPTIQEKEIISFGFKSYLFKVLSSSESIFDKLIVVTILSYSAFGEYSVSVGLSGLCYMIIVSPISKIFLPILNKFEEHEKVFIAIVLSKTTFLIILFLGILIINFSDNLVKLLYGNEFKNASTALAILMFGVIFKSPLPFLTHFYKSISKPEVLVKISLISLPINIIGSVVLIPLMGIKGAAIVSSVTYSLYSFLLVYKFMSHTNTSLLELLSFNVKDLRSVTKSLKLTIK